MDEKTLLTFMCVLIAFIVVLVFLGITLIVFLRVILSALSQIPTEAPRNEPQKPAEENGAANIEPVPEEEPQQKVAEEPAAQNVADTTEIAATQDGQVSESEQDDLSAVIPENPDEDESMFVTEKNERVRYDRSCAAKLCQLKNETKEWYTELKNELLSYEKVRARLSWRYETFRIGKTTVARFAVRGKTLCLLLAAEPANYTDTKYTVEDVSNNAATGDTPSLYRLKSARRVKYAKDLIADVMKQVQAAANPRYVAKDYFMPYEGDMALMQRGLVKRVVNNAARKYKIEEITAAGNNPSEV